MYLHDTILNRGDHYVITVRSLTQQSVGSMKRFCLHTENTRKTAIFIILRQHPVYFDILLN